MKRAGLAFAFLAFAGTASAAIFAPPAPATPVVTERPQEVKSSPVIKTVAAATIEGKRAPVPYVPQAKTPIQLATLTEPSVTTPTPEIRPTAPPAAFEATQAMAPTAKPDLSRATVKEVRSLSDSKCGGKSIKSIMVTGDGTVQVQC